MRKSFVESERQIKIEHFSSFLADDKPLLESSVYLQSPICLKSSSKCIVMARRYNLALHENCIDWRLIRCRVNKVLNGLPLCEVPTYEYISVRHSRAAWVERSVGRSDSAKNES